MVIRLLIAALLLSVVGCQSDDNFLNETSSKSKILKRHISFEEFGQNRSAMAKFNDLSLTSANARMVNDSLNNFRYDTDNIIYLANGEVHSYIIPIFRDEITDYVENVVLHQTSDSIYTATLVRYHLEEADREKIRAGLPLPDLVHKMEYKSLDTFALPSERFGAHEQQYYIINGVCCYVMDRVTSQFITFVYVGSAEELNIDLTWTEGENGGGGGGGNSSVNIILISGTTPDGPPDIPTHPGGGTGGSLPPTINTPVIVDRNLSKLNELTNSRSGIYLQIRNYIGWVRENIETFTTETGMEFRRGLANFTEIPPLSQEFDRVLFGPPASNTALYVHVHHTHEMDGMSLAPVPSDGDFLAFARTISQFNSIGKREFVSIVVTTQGLYAFIMTNEIEFQNFLHYISTPSNETNFNRIFEHWVIEKSMAEAAKRFNTTPGATSEDLQIWTGQKMEEAFQNFPIPTGISIYKGTISLNGVDYSWSKLNKY